MSAAGAAIGRRIGHQIHLPPRVSASVHVIHGDYTFKQLSDWRDTVFFTVLGKLTGVVSDDLDETHNRVGIGIEIGQEAIESSVLARLAAANIPPQAIRFESLRRPTPTIAKASTGLASATMTVPQSLGSWSDSLLGGLRIEYFDASNHAFLCSVGVTASFSDGSHGFVTASHCSSQMWGADNSPYYQPSNAYNNSYLGTEGYDLTAGTCPLLWPCAYYRYSDANLVRQTSTTRHWAPGIIARPTNRVFASVGQTDWNSAHPFLFVVGTATDVSDGQSIEKIGATSGWTYGTVTGTCMDINWFANDLDKCVYHTSLLVRGGDSGAPVFTWDGQDGVIVYGISFQGDTTGSTSYFSKWSYVVGEATGPGSFTSSVNVLTNITMSGYPAISGSLSGNSPTLSWSAVSVTNSSTPTAYNVYRSVWDASTYTWLDNGRLIGTTTSTSFTDSSLPVTVLSYVNRSAPAECVYTFVQYTVQAYNSGRSSADGPVFYQGNANGATPYQDSCP